MLLFFRLLLSMLALTCGVAFATESHCGAGEITYFSCKLRNSKIVSICGNFEPEGGEGEWIQYRFGHTGKIELTYPASRDGSVRKFEGNYFSPHGEDQSVIDLRFINNEALYSVQLVSENKGISGGVEVELPQNRRVYIPCGEPVEYEYWDSLLHLSGLLFERNGETDFLYTFNNSRSK